MERKTINVEEKLWAELGELHHFPDRTSFNEVIKFLLWFYKKEVGKE